MSIWKIALHGSDVHYNPDQSSEVALATIGVTDPLDDENWFAWDIIGAPTDRKQFDDIQSRNGVAYHSRGQKKVITLYLLDFIFPDEEHHKEALEELLNKPYIYFHQGTYAFDDWSIHDPLKCVMVAVTKQDERLFEDSCTRITLNLQLVNPVIS